VGDPIKAITRMFTPPGTGGLEAAQQANMSAAAAPPPIAPPPPPSGPPSISGQSGTKPSASTFIGTNLPIRPAFVPGTTGASSKGKSLLGQ